jgi:hypothetical protein
MCKLSIYLKNNFKTHCFYIINQKSDQALHIFNAEH